MRKIDSLQGFYELMHGTIPVRRQLVQGRLAGAAAEPEAVASLRLALASLEGIPEDETGRRVALDADRLIHLDLEYEIGELRKDLFFLEHDEAGFLGYLADLHPGFDQQVRGISEALAGRGLRVFVSDRDGTVNDYCARYASSVQSVWNAVFLTRFARSLEGRSVILTSAPMSGIGIQDVSVNPAGAFVLAGSKGREYVGPGSRRGRLAVPPEKQARLDELNEGLKQLLARPENELFALIGSGLQLKHGQTTVARQDVNSSMTGLQSADFMEQIVGLVARVDPEGAFFRIEDTGLDVEILLTVDDPGEDRDFDKGDGVRFLDQELELGLAEGAACLVCGDTDADLPMASVARELGAKTSVVFVTNDEGLRERAREGDPRTLFVDAPDVLVAVLGRLAEGSAS